MIVDENMPRIIEEVVYTTPAKYDTLLYVTRKILMGRIKEFCNSNPFLRNRGYEEDILINIFMRIYKYAKRDFFCSSPDVVNDNPRKLTNWIFTLAYNEMKSFAKIHGKYESNNTLSEEVREFLVDKTVYIESVRDTLQEAFDKVISSRVGIYKILTWVAMYLLILSYCEKKESVEMVEEIFNSLTLDEMYALLKDTAKKVPWLSVTAEQDGKIKSELDKIHKSGKRYGDVKYSDLYMKKGPKATVSDWLNRMNDYLDD